MLWGMFPLKAMSSVPDFFSSLHLAGITTLVGLQCAPGVEPLGTPQRDDLSLQVPLTHLPAEEEEWGGVGRLVCCGLMRVQ